MEQTDSNNIELLRVIIPALAGAIGVLIGIIVNTVSNWKLKTKETKLRLLEKMFDKRIVAHEDILSISKQMRTTISTNRTDDESNLITYPAILNDIEDFNSFKSEFYKLTNSNTHWIDITLFRELNFVQDYLATLSMHLDKEGNSVSVFMEIRSIIKQDIIDLASGLERITLKFFERDLPELRSPTTSGRHKYALKVTKKRLSETLLSKNILDIDKL